MGWGEQMKVAQSILAPTNYRERVELACDLREHAVLHSDSRDLLIRAADMLDPIKES